jgi:hypothetical protein
MHFSTNHFSPNAFFTESFFTECIFHRMHFQRIKTFFYRHRFRIFKRTKLTENNILSTQISATSVNFKQFAIKLEHCEEKEINFLCF